MRELVSVIIAGAAVVLLGAGVVRGLLGVPRESREAAMQFWLGIAMGLGGFAVSHACYLFWFDGEANGLILKDGLVALLGYICWRRAAGRADAETLSPSRARFEDDPPVLLHRVTWCVCVLALAFFVLRGYASPDGQWDAWMIWNLRARFLMVDGPGWVDGFSPLLHKSHPDYPILLPSLVAQGWRLFGVSPVVPLAVGGIFAMLAVGVLGSAVRLLRGSRSGLSASLLLLGTPCLVTRSANQLADLPVAVFVLVAGALLVAVAEGRVPRRGGTILAGVFASLAAWTKNEGALHLLALGVALVAVGRRAWRGRLAEAWWFGVGALPVVAMLFAFKFRYAPVNDLVGNTSPASVGERLQSADRYLTILQSYGQALLAVDKWGGMGLLAILLGVLFRPCLRGRAAAPLGLALGLLGAGFSIVYLLTPWDLHWHLATSLHRILLQCWPLGILTMFVALPPVPNRNPAWAT